MIDAGKHRRCLIPLQGTAIAAVGDKFHAPVKNTVEPYDDACVDDPVQVKAVVERCKVDVGRHDVSDFEEND